MVGSLIYPARPVRQNPVAEQTSQIVEGWALKLLAVEDLVLEVGRAIVEEVGAQHPSGGVPSLPKRVDALLACVLLEMGVGPPFGLLHVFGARGVTVVGVHAMAILTLCVVVD
jgi:hypothetical protein